MLKTGLVVETLVIWLAVGVAVAALLVDYNGSSEPPYTGPYKVKELVPTFETTTTR